MRAGQGRSQRSRSRSASCAAAPTERPMSHAEMTVPSPMPMMHPAKSRPEAAVKSTRDTSKRMRRYEKGFRSTVQSVATTAFPGSRMRSAFVMPYTPMPVATFASRRHGSSAAKASGPGGRSQSKRSMARPAKKAMGICRRSVGGKARRSRAWAMMKTA